MAPSKARLLCSRRGLVVILFVFLPRGDFGCVEANSITYTTQLDSKFQDGYFPLFDPSLGTLNEVDVWAEGEGGARIQFTPDITITNGTSTGTFRFYLFTPGPALILGPYVETSSFSTSTPGLADVSGSASGSASYTGDLSYFYLTNPFGETQFNVQISAGFTITSPTLDSQAYFQNDLGASGSASITYSFTPSVRTAIPEPSSIVLAGTGFAAAVGLASWLNRRRRANADAA